MLHIAFPVAEQLLLPSVSLPSALSRMLEKKEGLTPSLQIIPKTHMGAAFWSGEFSNTQKKHHEAEDGKGSSTAHRQVTLRNPKGREGLGGSGEQTRS